MSESTQKELTNMLENARKRLRMYARTRAPHVKQEFVEGLCKALGDISISEAYDALDEVEHNQADSNHRRRL